MYVTVLGNGMLMGFDNIEYFTGKKKEKNIVEVIRLDVDNSYS